MYSQSFFFFFNDPATPEIYTLSLTTLFRSAPRERGLQCAAIVRLTSSIPRLHPITWDSIDRKSTRLNSSHVEISYAVFCLKKKKKYIFLQISYEENMHIIYLVALISSALVY